MPTGYTALIDDDPNLSTAKWVTEGLSRAFGICVVLRDGPCGLTEDEIEEHLKKEIKRGTSYSRERLSETREKLKIIEADPETLNDLYASTVARLEDYNKRSMDEAKTTRLRHEQVEEDLVKLRDNTADEITRNIAKFGLSQLELVKRDREPYIQTIPSLEQFKIDMLASLKRDVEYHTKQIVEAEQREKERLLAYQTLRSEVGEILG